jgi:hypothetical protein
MLSSLLEADRVGRGTPITSADSRRVETDEQRRWWDPRFAAVVGTVPNCDREEMEEDERERS